MKVFKHRYHGFQHYGRLYCFWSVLKQQCRSLSPLVVGTSKNMLLLLQRFNLTHCTTAMQTDTFMCVTCICMRYVSMSLTGCLLILTLSKHFFMKASQDSLHTVCLNLMSFVCLSTQKSWRAAEDVSDTVPRERALKSVSFQESVSIITDRSATMELESQQIQHGCLSSPSNRAHNAVGVKVETPDSEVVQVNQLKCFSFLSYFLWNEPAAVYFELNRDCTGSVPVLGNSIWVSCTVIKHLFS